MSNENNVKSAAEIMAATMAKTLPAKSRALTASPIALPTGDELNTPKGRVYTALTSAEQGRDYLGAKAGAGTAAMHKVFAWACLSGRPAVRDAEMKATLATMPDGRGATGPHYTTLLNKGLIQKAPVGYALSDVWQTTIQAMLAAESTGAAAPESKTKTSKAKTSKAK